MMPKNLYKLSKILCIGILLSAPVQGFAQYSVSGTVTDKTSSEALPGVNVRVKNTTTGTATNAEGFYKLTASSKIDTLIFSFVGYETQQIPIDRQSEVSIALQQKTLKGEEMVVVGYGTQRQEDVTSAISSVNSDEFTESSPTDAASLIKGKVAGLSISNSSGNPTVRSNIRLRGTTSLQASNDPLVLVDGVPGNLNTVAPQNIESISVLKGGSAAAIYGSRGSNGVILIKTKTNEAGKETTIRYSGYVNIQTIKKKPDLLTAEGVREHKDEYSNLKDYGYSTNWLDVIIRKPISQDHNLSFSGGDAQTNYTASLNYENLQGLFLNSNNERILGHINIRHSMFENKLKANLNLIARSRDYWTGGDGSSWNGFVYRNALTRNPTDRPRDENGNYVYRSGFEYENPLVLIQERDGKNKERRLRMNGTLTFNPTQNLSFKLLGSTNQWNQTRGYAESLKDVSGVEGGRKAYASRGAGDFQENLLQITGTFQNNFGSNSVDLLGGYSWQKDVNADFYMQNWNFPTDAYTYNRIQSGNALSNGKAVENSSKSSYELISFFGRLNYNYDQRYLLMGSVRYEGSSKFGANNKWGIFPAVSVGWRISNEKFMENIDFISNLKIRAGYGVTGIAPSANYAALASLNYGGKIYDNGNWVQGLSPARNPNPNLRWEQKEEIDIGLDFSMFKSRFSGSFDVYRRNTKDLLHSYDVAVPPNVYPTILANVGEMRNEGIEAELNYNIKNSQSFSWNTTVTFSTNRNKLVRLSNDKYQTTNDYFYAGGTGAPIQLSTHRVKVGEPIGDFYGYKSVDINENGQWIVLDKNGDQVTLGDAGLEDRHVLGNGIPKYHLSWNNTFRYKNFDLNVTMRGAFGFQILNFQRMFYQNPTLGPENILKSSFDKIYGKHRINTSLAYVSYFVEDGDYWKLDDVTLGYTFDVGALNQYLKNARVYVSGKNLLTITGYKGIDPEVNTSGLAPGNDPRDKFPTTRTFTFGVNLKF